jgi:hypothetical protein
MRGRYRTWTRIRVNLQHVPEAIRPQQEALDPDDVVNEWADATPEQIAEWKTLQASKRKRR